MPKEKKDSAMDDFMAGLGITNTDPLESKDPFAGQEDGKEIVVENDKAEDKPLPFHKDPKVLRFIEKEVEKRTPKQVVTETQNSGTDDEGTALLERIIGNDTPERVQAVKDFKKYLNSLEEKGARKALTVLRQQSEATLEAERAAQRQLDDSFEEVEDAFNVDLSSDTPQARKTRAEFIDYIRKIAPKNEEGEVAYFPDIPAAWEEFQERSKRIPASASRAKELASKSISRSSDATVAPVQTKRDWKSIDRIFNNLTN